MILPLLLLAAPGAHPLRTRVEITEVIVRSHIVVRVQGAAMPVRPELLREKKGPRCVPLGAMAGWAVVVPNSVDLGLRDGRRLRLRFGASCPGLDYYSGFYVVPDADGRLCGGRDVVRDRAGGECPVERIRRLVPAR